MEDAAQVWSSLAEEWQRHWGAVTAPARSRLLEVAAVGPGVRVLDVGCGSGELVAEAAATGATATGVDPAPGMVEVARRAGLDVRVADAESLPWPDGTFDVVLSINALHLTEDPVAALREAARVVRPGGSVGLATWADAAHHDLDTIDRGLARALDGDDEPRDDPEDRLEGGLAAWLVEAGLTVVDQGLELGDWTPDDLAAAVLLGEDPGTIAQRRDLVLEVAAPFRDGDGHRLATAFRWAVARVSAG